MLQQIKKCKSFFQSKAEFFLGPLAVLGLRLYMAQIFFKSGHLKFENYLNDDWESTLFLFREIHPLPGIPVELAAVMGTAGELGLSVLLAVGFMGRFAAVGLFFMTSVIQFVMPEINVHLIWFLMLGALIAYGSGPLSVDGVFRLFSKR